MKLSLKNKSESRIEAIQFITQENAKNPLELQINVQKYLNAAKLQFEELLGLYFNVPRDAQTGAYIEHYLNTLSTFIPITNKIVALLERGKPKSTSNSDNTNLEAVHNAVYYGIHKNFHLELAEHEKQHGNLDQANYHLQQAEQFGHLEHKKKHKQMLKRRNNAVQLEK